MQVSLSKNVLNNDFSQFYDNLNERELYLSNDSKEDETKLRYTVTKFVGDWIVSFGTLAQWSNYENNTLNIVNNFAYNTSLDFVRYGIFGQASRKFLRNRLGFSIGMRTDGNIFTLEGNRLLKTLSPRLSLSYQ